MYFSELLYSGKSEDAARGFQLLLSDKKYTDLMTSEQKGELWQLLAVCYLRTGETQNCVVNHTSQSCIIPIKPEGQHKNVYGSTKALETYNAILKEYPNDLNSRWLMNIAAMTLGKYPEAVPEKYRIPENLFAKNEGFEPFSDIAIDLKLDVDGLAGGSVIEDFNNDGNLDIFVRFNRPVSPIHK
jgi:tetratricopeptide (TPR) repeat protein